MRTGRIVAQCILIFEFLGMLANPLFAADKTPLLRRCVRTALQREAEENTPAERELKRKHESLDAAKRLPNLLNSELAKKALQEHSAASIATLADRLVDQGNSYGEFLHLKAFLLRTKGQRSNQQTRLAVKRIKEILRKEAHFWIPYEWRKHIHGYIFHPDGRIRGVIFRSGQDLDQFIQTYGMKALEDMGIDSIKTKEVAINLDRGSVKGIKKLVESQQIKNIVMVGGTHEWLQAALAELQNMKSLERLTITHNVLYPDDVQILWGMAHYLKLLDVDNTHLHYTVDDDLERFRPLPVSGDVFDKKPGPRLGEEFLFEHDDLPLPGEGPYRTPRHREHLGP